jgi:hypothetical protein
VAGKEEVMAVLFVDGFENGPPEPIDTMTKRDRVRWLKECTCLRRGSVVADFPTMQWIGCPPVTFILTENPAGPQYPASVEVVLRYEP